MIVDSYRFTAVFILVDGLRGQWCKCLASKYNFILPIMFEDNFWVVSAFYFDVCHIEIYLCVAVYKYLPRKYTVHG